MTPIALTGFNRDVVVENTAPASFPVPTNYAVPFNTGPENNVYYQSNWPGGSYGLPLSGSFVSMVDGTTVFQLQPYTTNNVLDLNGATGLTNGTLTLATRALYRRVAVLANSANGDSTGQAAAIFNFSDGSTWTTNYFAPDWFFNSPYAWGAVQRINYLTGGKSGMPGDPAGCCNNPRFYQTTYDLDTSLGTSNKPLVSINFGKATGTMSGQAASTGIYALSGELSLQIPVPFLTARLAGTNVVLSCPSVTGWNYQLQYKDDLSAAGWPNLGGASPGTGSLLMFTNNPAFPNQRFYRMRVTP